MPEKRECGHNSQIFQRHAFFMPLPFSMGSIVAAVCGNTMPNLFPFRSGQVKNFYLHKC